jgi:hypothetical protein
MMSAQLQIDETPDYLEARFIGAGKTEKIEREFELLAEKCKLSNKNKLLLDLTGLPSDLSLVDIYFLGEKALVFRQYKCKVAAVGKPEQHDSHRFLELVSQNRQVNLRTFTDIKSAKEWLLKE